MTSATVHPPAGSGRPGPRSRPGGLPRLFWVLWSGILVNRLGTMAEPFLGVYLVAVRGFSVAAAGPALRAGFPGPQIWLSGSHCPGGAGSPSGVWVGFFGRPPPPAPSSRGWHGEPYLAHQPARQPGATSPAGSGMSFATGSWPP